MLLPIKALSVASAPTHASRKAVTRLLAPVDQVIAAPLMKRLGDMTREFNGRLYSAKDAAMTPEQFEAFYPNWREFARYRDPMITSSYWERVTGEKTVL